MNEKLELRKLLIYAISVYRIPQKIKGMTDKRKKKRDPVLQPYHASFYGPAFCSTKASIRFSVLLKAWGRRFGNFIRGRIPKVDAVRDALALLEADEVGGPIGFYCGKNISECRVPFRHHRRVYCGSG